MADSRVQRIAEDWVRDEWLPKKYGQLFRQDQRPLTAGGFYNFNAVSENDAIVASIATSSATTATGNAAAGKLQKLRADMLFLLMTQAKIRLIVLTEKDMFDLCMKEKDNGRVPPEIEFAHAQLPAELAKSLQNAKSIAAQEVSPRK